MKEAIANNEAEWHETSEPVIADRKHGTDFEIEMSMFLFKRLLYEDFESFKFTREKRGLGKFDDLTYMYETKAMQKLFSLVQLKHVKEETTKIGYNSLAVDTNSYFLLPKYYKYYVESKKNIAKDKDFQNYALDELVICTNIEFDEKLNDTGIHKYEIDNISLFRNSGDLYKLKMSQDVKRTIFADSYLTDLDKLAKELVCYMMLYKPIDVKSLETDDHVSMLGMYHITLAEHVIDVPNKILKDQFLESSADNDSEVYNFKDCFIKFVKEFCFKFKNATADDLKYTFKIKEEIAEQLARRIADYQNASTVISFLKAQGINVKKNFGKKNTDKNASKHPPDSVTFPKATALEANEIEGIDNDINCFLDKLTFAVNQKKNKHILRNELEEKVFIAFSESMGQWYSSAYYGGKGPDGKAMKKRNWITKENLENDALKTEVLFQGNEICLNQIVHERRFLDPDVLMRTFCSERITIGKRIDELGEIKNYYINRTMVRKPILTAESFQMNKSDRFVISCEENEENESFLRRSLPSDETLYSFDNVTQHSRFIVTSPTFEREQFENFVRENSDKYKWGNVHWIKCDDEQNLKWEFTHGSLEEIQSHFYTNEENAIYEQQDEICEKNRFLIVVGEPGMGKSTLVNSLTDTFSTENEKKDNPDFIIRILLKDCLKLLRKKEYVETYESIVDFLMDLKVFRHSFIRGLINHFLVNEERVILLFDGLDELYDEEIQDKILKLLVFLSKYACVKHVCVTTRPHCKEKIENALGIVSYSIKEITEEEQIYFLHKFWKQENVNLKEDDILEYSKKLTKTFNNNIGAKEKMFLGIPLQIYMFAVAFQQEISKENPQIPESLPVIALFEKFIATKYEIYLEEKSGEEIVYSSKQKSAFKSYDNLHQNFALCHGGLFPYEDAEIFLTQYDTSEENIVLEIGIVYKSVDAFHFTHRTFAEYLASKRLVNVSLNKVDLKKYNFDCNPALDKILLRSDMGFMLYLFDLQLVEDKKHSVHKSIMEGSELTAKNMNDTDLRAEDSLGRMPLYYAVHYNRSNVVSIFVDKETLVNLKDKYLILALKSYEETHYKENWYGYMVEKVDEFIDVHTKFAIHTLRTTGSDFPVDLANEYDLELETVLKNWTLVELMLKRGYNGSKLSVSLIECFRRFAPISIVLAILENMSTFYIDHNQYNETMYHEYIINYIYSLKADEVEKILFKYGNIIKDVVLREVGFFNSVYEYYYGYSLLEMLLTKKCLTESIAYVENQSKICSLLVRLVMGNKEILAHEESDYERVEGRVSRDQESLPEPYIMDIEGEVTSYLSLLGIEEGTLTLSTLKKECHFKTTPLELRNIHNVFRNYDPEIIDEDAYAEQAIAALFSHIIMSSEGIKLIFLMRDIRYAIEDEKSENLRTYLRTAEKQGWLKLMLNVADVTMENRESLDEDEIDKEVWNVISEFKDRHAKKPRWNLSTRFFLLVSVLVVMLSIATKVLYTIYASI